MPVPQCPNFLIDTSYVMHFAIHSTWAWYKREFSPNLDKDTPFDPSLDQDFMKEFEKKFKYLIGCACRRAYPMFDQKRFFYATDCSKANIWRVQHYAQYKLKRRHAPKQEITLREVFKYATNTLLPNLCEKYGSKIISVPNAEGDDIIAVCAQASERPVVIIASDSDFLQLPSNKVMIYDLFGKQVTLQRIKDKIGLTEENEFSANDYLLMKIIMGDGGDEIPAIYPKCGIKTAFKISKDKELLREALTKPGAAEAMKRNMLLIDFRNIPDVVKNDILCFWKDLSGEVKQSIGELADL